MKTLNFLVIMLAVFFSLGLFTQNVFAAGPATVNLGSAGNFTVLSEAGITDTGSHTTVITGDIGSSPITAAAMDNVFCSEINGTIYGVDAAYVGSGSQTCFMGNPPLSNKTLVDNAVGDMLNAYNDAAGRTLPTSTELGAGNIGGMTLAPGLYKWSTDVNIPTNVTLSGGPNDVWIFQISGNLNIASGASVPAGVKVILSGGAQVSNIFWQVGGVTGATLGTYSTFNVNILSAKQIIIQTGAGLNGRAFAQTQVTLDANLISFPTLIVPTPPLTSVNTTSSSHGGGFIIYGCKDPTATNYNEFSSSDPSLCKYATPTITPIVSTVTTPTNTVITPTPDLPKTGFPPKEENTSNNIVLLSGALVLSVLSSIYFVTYLKKQKI